MAGAVQSEKMLAAKFAAVLPHLDERQRRLVLGAEARALGHGGIKVVAAAAGTSAVTVSRGVAELESGDEPLRRTRRPGGGRKSVTETDPGVIATLLSLVEPSSRGDPESPLRWTTKSVRRLSESMSAAGHKVSPPTVAKLLKAQGFSLQANVKTVEGRIIPIVTPSSPTSTTAPADHLATGDPVISVDTKKKELVGAYKNKGREWRPKGEPEPVKVHDFVDPELGKANPYGVYDVGSQHRVGVGGDRPRHGGVRGEHHRHLVAERRKGTYPAATRLMVSADGGGSNGYRTRAWKTELAALAADTGLTITVCHLPPGTSKWNKIEHRLFSHISMNWRGRPLTSHDVIVEAIAATTTSTGLTVRAELDDATYPTGVKIPDSVMKSLETNQILTRHEFHGEWNYTLHPERSSDPP